MPCYHPLQGWPSAQVNDSGRRSMVFTRNDALMPESLPMAIPCGQCIGCRMEYARQWAVRCMHESSLHLFNSFITLTFADEWMNPVNRLSSEKYDKLKDEGVCLDSNSLLVADFQLFMKRLRKKIAPEKVRFYHCGEYGDKNGRPHHHALLFGYDFPDKVQIGGRGNNKYFRSPMLEELWPFGISVIGSVTYESASYVARYINKKQRGDAGELYYNGLKPPYVTMSRKPGIAKEWIEKWANDVFAHDVVVVDGFEGKPPKYYDKHLEDVDGKLHKKIKRQRIKKMEERGMDKLASFDDFKNRSRELIKIKQSGQLTRNV